MTSELPSAAERAMQRANAKIAQPTKDEPREQYGYKRTEAATEADILNCKHMPGCLVPDDVQRMRDALHPGMDYTEFAERHLEASEGSLVVKDGHPIRLPTLVPKRNPETGHCHWFDATSKRCTIHKHAPFGCAFFDAHMPKAEGEARSKTMNGYLWVAWMTKWTGKETPHIYTRLVTHLRKMGQVAPKLSIRKGAIAAAHKLRQAHKDRAAKRRDRKKKSR